MKKIKNGQSFNVSAKNYSRTLKVEANSIVDYTIAEGMNIPSNHKTKLGKQNLHSIPADESMNITNNALQDALRIYY